jgi:hypothetical protein|tara:strand:+ start:553 stop:975 length:423 start_codon:yes stop_codon:yes gene_type:complete
MKFGKLRTLRGQIEVTGGGVARENLIASDGLINFGLVISRFQVWAVDVADTFNAILSYDTIPAGTQMNAGDNRQFAWTIGNGSAEINNEVVDPQHIVNRDCFLTLVNSENGVYNYLIECQVVELTDDEAIVTIIKETSQS